MQILPNFYKRKMVSIAFTQWKMLSIIWVWETLQVELKDHGLEPGPRSGSNMHPRSWPSSVFQVRHKCRDKLGTKKRARTCDVRAKGNHELLAIDADLVIVRHLGCWGFSFCIRVYVLALCLILLFIFNFIVLHFIIIYICLTILFFVWLCSMYLNYVHFSINPLRIWLLTPEWENSPLISTWDYKYCVQGDEKIQQKCQKDIRIVKERVRY